MLIEHKKKSFQGKNVCQVSWESKKGLWERKYFSNVAFWQNFKKQRKRIKSPKLSNIFHLSINFNSHKILQTIFVDLMYQPDNFPFDSKHY